LIVSIIVKIYILSIVLEKKWFKSPIMDTVFCISMICVMLKYSTAKEISKRGHEAFIFMGYPVKGAVEASHAYDRYEYDGISVNRFFNSKISSIRTWNPMEAEYNNLFYADFFADEFRS